MTLEQIKTAINGYVLAAKSAGTWTPSTDNVAGLLDKIAKTITIDGSFNDKLAVLDGEQLPLGKTIEEYFQDLCDIANYNAAGDSALAPHNPTYKDPAYSYTLGKKVIPTTLRYNEYERACNSPEELSSMTQMVLKRLHDTNSVFRYGAKKQMLANLIAKAEAASNNATLIKQVAPVTDAESGEAFIKEIKEDIEKASFVNEGNALEPTATIGASEGLLLIVKKGIKPVLDTAVMAGAFNPEKLGVDAQIIVVDDFGNADDKYDAILVDKRALRLHPTYQAVREQPNGEGDFVNFYLHTENTAFISKFCFVRVYKHAA